MLTGHLDLDPFNTVKRHRSYDHCHLGQLVGRVYEKMYAQHCGVSLNKRQLTKKAID